MRPGQEKKKSSTRKCNVTTTRKPESFFRDVFQTIRGEKNKRMDKEANTLGENLMQLLGRTINENALPQTHQV